jgi:hypothetical protein
MRVRPAHRASYHEWPNSTPIVDVARCLIAVASVLIGTYAVLFAAFAVAASDWALAAKNGAFLVAVAIANVAGDAVRRWRQHHG